MLRHLCSVHCECRAASELAGSHSLRAGGNNQRRKDNSHLSSETILSVKVSQSILLCIMGFFSLEALQQAAYKWIREAPQKRGPCFLKMEILGVKQMVFKISVTSEMTQLKLRCLICCSLSSKKKSSFQILNVPNIVSVVSHPLRLRISVMQYCGGTTLPA